MYCRKCYQRLDPQIDSTCPKCKTAFGPNNPRTYLNRPFPPISRIVQQLFRTTLVVILVALAVSFFQAVFASGP
jgi:hypothetical protein